MKCYLAGAWSRQEELRKVAEDLVNVGIEVTSRWLEEPTCPPNSNRHLFLRNRAYEDLRDVDDADILVRFTDKVSQTKARTAPNKLLSAARMVEFGYAKARGKALYVVGGVQNVFDRLDGVVHVKDDVALIRALSRRKK